MHSFIKRIFGKMINIKNVISNTERYKRIVANMISLFILQGANYILPLITVPYIVRTLGAEKYGLIAFAMAFTAFFQVITDYGFNLSATRKISIFKQDKEKIANIYSSVIVIKFILCIISLLILLFTIVIFERFRSDFITYLYAFGAVIGNVFFSVWFFQGIERMKYITYLNLFSRGLYTVLIFLLVKAETDYNILIILNSLVPIINGLLSSSIIYYKYKIKLVIPNKQNIIKELNEGWHIFTTSLLSNILAVSGTFILGLFHSKEVVGYYAAIDKILKAFNGLMSPITQAIFPFISSNFGKSYNNGILAIKNVSKFILPLAITLSGILFIFSEYIISFLYGKEYLEFSIILKYLSIWITLGIINNIIGIQFLIGSGRGSEYSRAFVLAASVTIIIYFTMVNNFSFYAIIIGMLIGESLLTLSMLYRIQKLRLYKRKEEII
jgi:polysaccharide transporter, PST family